MKNVRFIALQPGYKLLINLSVIPLRYEEKHILLS